MKVVIAGGGEIGVAIADKLIAESHNVTLIEQSSARVKVLRNELDALIIQGDGLNVKILDEAGVNGAVLFLALTGEDKSNLLSCGLAKKLAGEGLFTVAKIEETGMYFSDKRIQALDFGVDMVINPKELFIQKVLTLVDNVQVVEWIKDEESGVHILGIRLTSDFVYLHQTLDQIGEKDKLFSLVRVFAIHRKGSIRIPKGSDVLESGDVIYLIGNREVVGAFLKIHASKDEKKLNQVLISGGTNVGRDLAQRISALGKTVTLIEEDPEICRTLAFQLKDVLIFNGSSTDASVLKEVHLTDSCFISVSEDDEYNLISAVYAGQNGSYKNLSMIKNMALVSIVHGMQGVDVVISPQKLCVGEIMRLCRRENMLSSISFSEINAETITLVISEELPILGKPIRNLKLPEDLLIGAIVRGKEVLIPKGDNILKRGDKLILFVLSGALPKIERIFSQEHLRRTR